MQGDAHASLIHAERQLDDIVIDTAALITYYNTPKCLYHYYWCIVFDVETSDEEVQVHLDLSPFFEDVAIVREIHG